MTAALFLNAPLNLWAEQAMFQGDTSELTNILRQGGFTLLAIPKNSEVDDEGRNGLRTFLKSCPSCQNIPQIPRIDDDPRPVIRPKITRSPSEICDKFPGKFGCPKNEE